MLRASNFVFFAYVGFESITSVAQEAKQPSRSMPCAILISFTIMALIYISVSIVMVGLVPYQALNTTYPLITAA
jgi:amino acid transporter